MSFGASKAASMPSPPLTAPLRSPRSRGVAGVCAVSTRVSMGRSAAGWRRLTVVRGRDAGVESAVEGRAGASTSCGGGVSQRRLMRCGSAGGPAVRVVCISHAPISTCTARTTPHAARRCGHGGGGGVRNRCCVDIGIASMRLPDPLRLARAGESFVQVLRTGVRGARLQRLGLFGVFSAAEPYIDPGPQPGDGGGVIP